MSADALTEAQERAVTADSDSVLVVAGAGSGKTRLLCARVLHLLEQRGRSPSELMVLTFTRKAAGEMIRRLTEALGRNPAEEGMLIGTFHSVALRILRQHGALLGYDVRSLTVIEPDESDLLLRQVCRDLGYYNGKTWTKGLSWAKVTAALEAVYRLDSEPLKCDDLGRSPRYSICKEYFHQLRSMNALDFGLILFIWQELFRQHPELRRRYHAQIKAVLVDEIQDLDQMQHYFLSLFGPPAQVFAVGDPRQSIYGFRGADSRFVIMLGGLTLPECFRCGDSIIEAANRLINHNDDTYPPMVGTTGFPGGICIKVGPVASIASRVGDLTISGHALDDIAILARTHAQLLDIAGALTDEWIPFHRVGSRFDITRSTGFKVVHASMRLTINPRDQAAFAILGDIWLTSLQYAEAQELAATQGRSAWIAAGELFPWLDKAPTKLKKAADDLEASRISWDDAVRTFVATVGAPPRSTLGSDVISFWTNVCPCRDLESALDWFALRDSQDDVHVEGEVALLTIHAAKGLEWPAVIVANVNEKSLPFHKANTRGEIAEERRLAYVAMTRAIESLTLHYQVEPLLGRSCAQRPSRFLYEAGLLERGNDS